MKEDKKVTKVRVRGDVVAEALAPLELRVTKMEWANTEGEAARLIAEHGTVKRT
jgi:hypothetical protein